MRSKFWLLIAVLLVATTVWGQELDDAALRAARKARFVPAKSGATSVAATVRITIAFQLK